MDDGQETTVAEMPLYNGPPFPPNEQTSDNPKRSDCNGASDKQNVTDKHSRYRKSKSRKNKHEHDAKIFPCQDQQQDCAPYLTPNTADYEGCFKILSADC